MGTNLLNKLTLALLGFLLVVGIVYSQPNRPSMDWQVLFYKIHDSNGYLNPSSVPDTALEDPGGSILNELSGADTSGATGSDIWKWDGTNDTFKMVTDNVYVVDGTLYAQNDTGIQNAINDANSAGGGTVYISQGTITCDSGITPKSNVKIKGAGKGATTLNISGANVSDPYMGCSGSYVNSTTFGAEPARGDTQITLSSATGYAVDDYIRYDNGTLYEMNKVKAISGSDIDMVYPMAFELANGDTVQEVSGVTENFEVGDLGFSVDGDTYIIKIEEISDAEIKNIKLDTNGFNSRFFVESFIGLNVENVLCDKESISRIDARKGRFFTIQKNRVRTIEYGVRSIECSAFSVENNTLVSTNVSALWHGVVFVDNSIDGSISDNAIYVDKTSTGAGIFVQNEPSDFISITGNFIFQSARGVYLKPATDYCTVSGNTIDGAGTADVQDGGTNNNTNGGNT